MDIVLAENGEFSLPIDEGWNSIIFVYDGELQYKGDNASHVVKNLDCCVLENSQEKKITHSVTSKNGAKFILIGGQPLKEPVANYGPFVMNTQQQLQMTIRDYQTGKNGFENAPHWESKIQYLAKGKSFEEL